MQTSATGLGISTSDWTVCLCYAAATVHNAQYGFRNRIHYWPC
jgi:hypothetical protein